LNSVGFEVLTAVIVKSRALFAVYARVTRLPFLTRLSRLRGRCPVVSTRIKRGTK
jgi:hypothetical protein